MFFSVVEGTQAERLSSIDKICCGWQHPMIWSSTMRAYCSPVCGGSSCLWLGEWGQSCEWLGWCKTASFWWEKHAWQESWEEMRISAPLSGFEHKGYFNLATNPGTSTRNTSLFESYYVERKQFTSCNLLQLVNFSRDCTCFFSLWLSFVSSQVFNNN